LILRSALFQICCSSDFGMMINKKYFICFNIFGKFSMKLEFGSRHSYLSVVRVFRNAEAVLYRRLWFGFCLSLGGRGLVLQPSLSDSLLLDLLSHFQDFRAATVVDVGRGQVCQALMIAVVVVVVDEGANLAFQVAG
jgi:hypothetical protein